MLIRGQAQLRPDAQWICPSWHLWRCCPRCFRRRKSLCLLFLLLLLLLWLLLLFVVVCCLFVCLFVVVVVVVVVVVICCCLLFVVCLFVCCCCCCWLLVVGCCLLFVVRCRWLSLVVVGCWWCCCFHGYAPCAKPPRTGFLRSLRDGLQWRLESHSRQRDLATMPWRSQLGWDTVPLFCCLSFLKGKKLKNRIVRRSMLEWLIIFQPTYLRRVVVWVRYNLYIQHTSTYAMECLGPWPVS